MPDTPAVSASIWFATLTEKERTELTPAGGTTLDQRPDVLIVGGGIIGLSLAYYLAERGTRVQLIEAGDLASGASGANFGGIWPNDQGLSHPAGFQALAFLSRDLWGRLAVRPEFDFDWRVNGLLNVNPEKFPPSATGYASAAQEEGYSVTAVDGEQIAILEPQLKQGLTEGLHYHSEAHVHPVKAVLSLARAARKKQARIATGVRAVSCETTGGRVTAIETTAGRVEPGQVIAATAWTATWLGAAGPDKLPLRPVSGQMLSTGPLAPVIKQTIMGQFLIAQLRTGEIITGGTITEGDTLVPTEKLSNDLIAAARDLIPALRDIPFTRAWCGIRPGTPDGMPIIDRSPAAENLWLACGHYRNGVLLAPATGKLLSDWIVTGTRAEELEPFACSRFS